VDAKPSYLMKLMDADLLIAVGLELEIGWLPVLVKECRNPAIVSGKGYLDASTGVEVLEKPTGNLTRAEGDVHPYGNPHYWLDPENGAVMAANIAGKFSELDPANADFYRQNLEALQSELNDKLKNWEELLAPYRGSKVVIYHKNWEYFTDRFGLVITDEIEPKPGIPPTPGHTLDVIKSIKDQGVKIIISESYYELRTPRSISEKTGAKLLVLPTSVGGAQGVENYVGLIDYNVRQLANSLK
jgi:ABC-type Zn uptake system ZnuABC Zn-binding protein ZnuA